jgi:sec1 family domain-containing protein 1
MRAGPLLVALQSSLDFALYEVPLFSFPDSAFSPNSLLQDFMKTFSELVSASVKYLVPENKDYHITRIVDSVMELKDAHGVENYLYLDPKFPPNQAPRKNTPFRESIVFVVGGGNYIEYQNLQDYASRSTQQKQASVGKTIIYGTTEMLTSSQFIDQISKLSPKLT